MKTHTRVMAWIYILAQAPIVLIATALVVVLVVGGAGAVVGAFKTGLFSSWIDRVLGLGALLLSLIVAATILLNLIPWICLLKKRAWAWWVLTIESACCAIGISFPGNYQLLSVSVLAILTLVMLLTDRPPWRTKRATTRRRRATRRRRR